MGDKDMILDLYYTESGRRSEKELVWAGDGIQIWLQLLLHLFRSQKRDVVVLDEPDVFLHPDLQRRLVWLLEYLPGQTITATHSSEVLVEAAPESVVWVDKTRSQSVGSPNEADLASLSASLGTRFNLPLARALRAKRVLFVEGDDVKTLRRVARTIGASRVASESGIAVIPLKGFDNWSHVEPFTWMTEQLLEGTVEVFVVLDRDYRAESECKLVGKKLEEVGVHSHIWRRKELESYLLESSAIARLSGASDKWVEEALAEAAEESEGHVHAQITARALRRFPHDQPTQAITEAKAIFDGVWANVSGRKWVAPPDNVLHGLNRRLSAQGYKSVSFAALAREIQADEVPDEMASFLEGIEESLRAAGVSSFVR
jgi:hypothetical protein